jgi:23S rRNA U2552 (ribose-2'-O)-methylase RlmE/FtsJ
MSYYLFPNVTIFDIETKINFLFTTENNKGFINGTLNRYLNNIKTQINNYSDKWDIYKKYTNQYEYIHTLIPGTKLSICKLKPLSRSFYKMIEICNLHKLIEDLKTDTFNSSLRTFHLAEGPGGFIEAFTYLRNNTNDVYIGMTLQDEHVDVPGWKKTAHFLKSNPNVFIENGVDGTGNLISIENFIYCINKHEKFDIITGDGGFDFSIDFNNQENTSLKLIFTQICYAIGLQKKHGSFVLKVFDIFTKPTVELMFLLSTMYEKVYITKPYTSRPANSEKYIVCKNFILPEEKRRSLVLKVISTFVYLEKPDYYLNGIFNFNLPYLFVNKMEEFNAIFGQQQIENISNTVMLVECHKPDKLENIKKNNISKGQFWCQKHHLPFNKNIQQNNIFLTSGKNTLTTQINSLDTEVNDDKNSDKSSDSNYVLSDILEDNME